MRNCVKGLGLGRLRTLPWTVDTEKVSWNRQDSSFLPANLSSVEGAGVGGWEDQLLSALPYCEPWINPKARCVRLYSGGFSCRGGNQLASDWI